MEDVEELWHETIDESSEQAENESPEPQKPDPLEVYKAELETVKSQLPTAEERELLGVLKGLRQPKEQGPSEADQKLAAAIETLSKKGVLTQDNPEVARVLAAISRIEQKEKEQVASALREEGFKGGIPQLEAKVSDFYYDLEEKEQKELSSFLNPYYDKNGLKDPVGAAKAFKAFKEKLEGATPPSKSISTSIAGRSSVGTNTSSMPDRATFFREIYPKMTNEQKEKVMSGQSKPYKDY